MVQFKLSEASHLRATITVTNTCLNLAKIKSSHHPTAKSRYLRIFKETIHTPNSFTNHLRQ